MPVLEGTAISISDGLTQVTSILSSVADIVTSNILYMLPVAAGFVFTGIGIFKKLRH